MSKKLNLTCFLVVMVVVCSFLITLVNNVTSPIIQNQAMGKETEIFKVIDSNAKFSEAEFVDDSGFVKKAYISENGDNSYYVYIVEVVGFNSSSSIQFYVGFNKNGETIFYNVISQEETEGLGSKVAAEEFTNQILKSELTAISGATISSEAVIKGIEAAKLAFSKASGTSVTIEEKKVELKVNKDDKSLSDDLSQFDAKCELKETDSNGNNVFSCNSKGYGLIDPDNHSQDGYSRNEATITINTKDLSIVSITFDKFGDTKNIGDKATNIEYLDSFALKTADSKFDTVTGATWTSDSLIAMVQAALNESK